MKVIHYTEVEKDGVKMEGADGTSLRWALGPADNMPNFYLRVVEVEAGGYTPRHNHPYEHEVYILDGQGELIDPEGNPLELRPGNIAYVAPDELHQFRNAGEEVFRFICIIPKVD